LGIVITGRNKIKFKDFIVLELQRIILIVKFALVFFVKPLKYINSMETARRWRQF
jgi:hypothetical protein